MICTICNGTLSYNVPPKPCFRCKGTGKVAEGWFEPSNPDIHHIRALAREVGYAISTHGSQLRDFDIIATPWSPNAVGNADLIKHLCTGIPARVNGLSPKALGRYAFTLEMDGYIRPIDISVAPRAGDYPEERQPGSKQVESALEELAKASLASGVSQEVIDAQLKTIRDYISIKSKGVVPTSWFTDD